MILYYQYNSDNGYFHSKYNKHTDIYWHLFVMHLIEGQTYLLFIDVDMELKVYWVKKYRLLYNQKHTYTIFLCTFYKKTIQYNGKYKIICKDSRSFGNNINLG